MGRNVYVKGRRTKKRMRNYNQSVSSSEISESTAMSEEEDMAANCLILLAQGRTSNVEGIFKCKTCNKNFPSYQALGGHRTSHKRLKSTAVEVDDAVTTTTTTTATMKISLSTFTNNASGDVIGAVKSKVHECSICGLEFSSGQALGGHMRRHRSLLATPGQVKRQNISKEEGRFGLDLDLNLPAPSDDDGKITFVSRQALIFSSLGVNFHY